MRELDNGLYTCTIHISVITTRTFITLNNYLSLFGFWTVKSLSDTLEPVSSHFLICPALFPLQTVSTASELRKPIYWIVAAKAIDYEQMLLLMVGVKWDIKEIMSQHNVYVDVLLKVMCLCGRTMGFMCESNGSAALSYYRGGGGYI